MGLWCHWESLPRLRSGEKTGPKQNRDPIFHIQPLINHGIRALLLVVKQRQVVGESRKQFYDIAQANLYGERSGSVERVVFFFSYRLLENGHRRRNFGLSSVKAWEAFSCKRVLLSFLGYYHHRDQHQHHHHHL